MKKSVLGLLSIFVLSILSCAFIACSSSDDDDSSGTPKGEKALKKAIVGTWKASWDEPGAKGYFSLTFQSDGKGYDRYYNKTEEFTDDLTTKFRYEIESSEDVNIIKFYYDGSSKPRTLQFKIENNVLYMEYSAMESEFVKQ